MNLLFSPRGTIGRLTYAGISGGLIVAYAAFKYAQLSAPNSWLMDPSNVLPFLGIVLWVHTVSSAKRLADMGHSRWLTVLMFVPLISVAMMVYISLRAGEDRAAKAAYAAVPARDLPRRQAASPVPAAAAKAEPRAPQRYSRPSSFHARMAKTTA